MKVSNCCHEKMTKHSITKIKICSKCGHAARVVEMKEIKKQQNANARKAMMRQKLGLGW